MDVVVWLRSLGLGKYEAAFRENEIDETVLPGLTAEDLKELDVAALGAPPQAARVGAILHETASPTCSCIGINRRRQLAFRRNSILANSSTNRTLTANRFHAVGSPASTAQAIRLASLAELHSGCLVPDLSQRARRIAPLPSCKATNHSHSLIEGGELSWAQSLLPLTGAKGRNRQIVPKMGLNSPCENARQGSGCRTLRNPEVLARVSNGPVKRFRYTGEHSERPQIQDRPISGLYPS
jgi:SAM domain (Sterile alpha motif)